MSQNQLRKPPVTACHLWLKERPDGRYYMTGKLGNMRVIIRPIDGAAPGQPEYSLEFAETDRTISAPGGAA
jgi:hypothetical protein